METYYQRDALKCICSNIVYVRQDLSKRYKKDHLYEVLKVDGDIVHILDDEGFDYIFMASDVSKFFEATPYQFPLEPPAH